MASGFPGSIDNFTNPLSNSALSSPSHSGQHSDVNDAVNKIETYMGLVKVIPTSGTNCTIAANGTVTIGNAVSSFTVNGAFTSAYRSYRIVARGGTCSAEGSAWFQLTSAGTALTTGYYGTLIYNGAGSLLSARDTNNSSFALHAAHGNVGGITLSLDLHSPAEALMTWMANSSYVRYDYMGTYNGYNNSSVAYDGFKITPSSGTITGGTVSIYGYRN